MPVYTARANILMLGQARALKALNTLICDAYMGKPMSLGDMDRDGHTAVTLHTI